MAEPKKKKKNGTLSVNELIDMAKAAVQTRRSALERQAWLEGAQEEAKRLEAELKRIEAEDYSKRPNIRIVNPHLLKRLDLQDAQQKLDEIRQQIPKAGKASEDTKQTEDMFMDNYQKCADTFASEADAEDLVDMGRHLKCMKQQAEDLKAQSQACGSYISELEEKFAQIQAEDYSQKPGAKVVNPETWKRMDLEEIEEPLAEASGQYPMLKSAAEDAECLADLFRKAYEHSLKVFIRGDKERLKKLKAQYIKEEMQDTLREQRELMGNYNWDFDEKEDGTHQEKGLVTHINKLLESRSSRHSSKEWDKMCDALSKLHIKDIMDEMWDPREPLNYDKEKLRELREQIDEAIRQTGAYVNKKKDTFLIKVGIGKGPGYLKEARESLQALKNIKNCIDTMDKEYVRVAKEADQRYRPTLGNLGSIRNSTSAEPQRSAIMVQSPEKQPEKKDRPERTRSQAPVLPR